MSFNSYSEIKFEDMKAYIDEKAPEFKDEFKKSILVENKNGEFRYNHAKAKRVFCENFMPELIPEKKAPKKSKTQIIEEW